MKGNVARQQQKGLSARGRQQVKVRYARKTRQEAKEGVMERKERRERFRRCREGSH